MMVPEAENVHASAITYYATSDMKVHGRAITSQQCVVRS